MQHLPTLRLEASGDRDAVRRLLTQSFPTAFESDLVDKLRADGDVVLALVADDGGSAVGYACFSLVSAPFVAAALAPVAVSVDRRRQGIATALIITGLSELRAIGIEAAFVLGDPAYYARFGFDAAAASGFESPYAGPHFMVTSLTAARLPATTGLVEYPAAFSDLS